MTRGIIGLANEGPPRKPDDRQTRAGVTMAFDQRVAVALLGSSGEGAAKLQRRNFGEVVENLTAA